MGLQQTRSGAHLNACQFSVVDEATSPVRLDSPPASIQQITKQNLDQPTQANGILRSFCAIRCDGLIGFS